MQYDVATPEEYLAALDADWRRDTLIELRNLVFELAPDIKEEIKYRMLSYDDDQGGLFGLNAQKHYVSFYVGDISKVDPAGELLKDLSMGKGCIRFSKTRKVADTRMREFITRALAHRQAGADIDC